MTVVKFYHSKSLGAIRMIESQSLNGLKILLVKSLVIKAMFKKLHKHQLVTKSIRTIAITTLRKNMKPRVLDTFEKLLLSKRNIIAQLKNIFYLDHLRHHSLSNCMINVVSSFSGLLLPREKTIFKKWNTITYSLT
jgi:hypothetical protein